MTFVSNCDRMNEWYCGCAGSSTHVTFWSWSLHTNQFIDLCFVSFWAGAIGFISSPQFDQFHAPCLRAERDWIVRLLQLWLLGRVYVCLKGYGNSLKSGVWVQPVCLIDSILIVQVGDR